MESGLLWRSRLSEDKIAAEFFTKTERKKCKNTPNILLEGCYLYFEEYLQGKKISLYVETVRRNRPKFRRKSTRR